MDMEHIDSYETAFDLHTSYVEWRESHPNDDRILHDGFWRALQNDDVLDALPVTTTTLKQSMEESKIYHDIMRTLDDCTVSRADTVYLSDELRELVNTAEATMPDEILFDTDVYTPCGFVVMETPLTHGVLARCLATDIDAILKSVDKFAGTVTGERLYGETDNGSYIGTENWSVQAFSWASIEVVTPILMESLARQFGKNSEQYESANAMFSNQPVKGLHFRMYGTMESTTVDGLTITVPAMKKAPMRLINSFVFMFGVDGFNTEEEMKASGDDEHIMYQEANARHTQVRRFAVAMFRLMEEYIEVDKSKVGRQFARRAERGGRAGNTKEVTVLSLRRDVRETSGDGTGTKITLAHLVRGHWRNQWYPSQQAHRAKWIREHRRGGNAGDTPVAKRRIIRVDR
jgi:hypothetical protein